jgi:predicted nucleic acid-binding protein
LDFDLAAERERVFALMETYADQPMSLADACLVRMSELHEGAAVFTLDRHFRVYRRNRRQVLPVIIPAEI